MKLQLLSLNKIKDYKTALSAIFVSFFYNVCQVERARGDADTFRRMKRVSGVFKTRGGREGKNRMVSIS